MEGDLASKASPHPAQHPDHGKPVGQGTQVPLVPEGVMLTPAQVRELKERPDPFLEPWEEDADATDTLLRTVAPCWPNEPFKSRPTLALQGEGVQGPRPEKVWGVAG